MIQMNEKIIYVRSYSGSGSLIPIKKVMLVTTDPNSGKVLQEIPLADLLEKLMYHNMHAFENPDRHWRELENQDMVKGVKS